VCRILWAEPPAEALVEVRRNRRQIYASYIKTLALGFTQDPTLNTLFGGLKFPRLQDLSLFDNPTITTRNGSLGSHVGCNMTVSQYFGPALERLELRSCNAVCSPTFLTDIAARPLRLKSIKWFHVGVQLQANDLLKFFETCNHLVDVYLDFSDTATNSLVTSDILLCLSRMRKLESLSIDPQLDRWESFKTIKDQNSTPFPSLKNMSLLVSSGSIHSVPLRPCKYFYAGAQFTALSPHCHEATHRL
jgi:hypothetical protein